MSTKTALLRPSASPAPRGSGCRIRAPSRPPPADTGDGFEIADVPERGGPVDGSLLDGAISKAKQAGMQVRSVYADRGFGTSTADAALAHHRIRDL